MCYSPESSFGTFFFVSIICIVLWKKDKPVPKTLAIVLLFIALMQVIEGFLWLNLECSTNNKVISSFIPIVLYLQPLVALGSIYFFKSGLLSSNIYLAVLIGWLCCIPFAIDYAKDGLGKCTIVGPKGNLQWPYTNSSTLYHELVYNTVIGFSIVTLNTEWYGFFYTIVATVGYLKSRELYGHSWGSVWCHFVNSLAVGALFI